MKVCVAVFTWAFIYCALAGPAVPSTWDITGDGRFDLRDVAKLQNSARVVDGQVKFEVTIP